MSVVSTYAGAMRHHARQTLRQLAEWDSKQIARYFGEAGPPQATCLRSVVDASDDLGCVMAAVSAGLIHLVEDGCTDEYAEMVSAVRNGVVK